MAIAAKGRNSATFPQLCITASVLRCDLSKLFFRLGLEIGRYNVVDGVDELVLVVCCAELWDRLRACFVEKRASDLDQMSEGAQKVYNNSGPGYYQLA